MVQRLFCILIMVLTIVGQSWGQKQKSDKDSIGYGTIAKNSQKTKLNKFLNGFLFRPISKAYGHTIKHSENEPKTNNEVKVKIVRNIYITSLDPFGYSIRDTSVLPKGFLIKTVNQLHVQTRNKVISDLLLFKKNEPFDSLLVIESERLIRSQKYIQDVVMSTYFAAPKSDSVDVYIKVSDVWSIWPSLSVSASKLEMGITDNNFIGLGNSLHLGTKTNSTYSGNVKQIGYVIPNFKNTHITASFQYYYSGNIDLFGNPEFTSPVYSPISSNLQYLTLSETYLVKSFELLRTFYSPVARWAGGLFIGQLKTSQNYVQGDSLRYLSARTNIQDFWGARSWQLNNENSLNDRTKNFIVSGRILRTRYPDKSMVASVVNIFNNENIYFAGIGITSRKFIKDRYIFNYGKVEDIPIGSAFGLTFGINNQHSNRYYLGLKAAWGDYYTIGYMSSIFEYGTLMGGEGFQQQVITGKINYYTNLFSIGYWKVRQFIRPTFIAGFKRLPNDNLSLNDVIIGFSGLNYPATRMISLTLQTQSYAPWELYGFRFGPYIFSSLGMLGNSTSGISNSHLYSVLGFGVLIKNNYLLLNTFQISLTFYPLLPGIGNNILNINAYRTSDYGFDDFEISKPNVVDYR